MDQDVHRCKGMKDMLPDDMALFRHIEQTFRNLCQKWGYREIRTPVVEYLHLFTASGTLTPSKLGQTYSFLDWDGWSGERVVLRPDSTIPTARLYVDNLDGMGKARLCYVHNVFTFEPSGLENREKWQCGAEFIGGTGPLADAEIVLMAVDILKTLGIKNIEIQISHAGLIKTLLGEIEKDPAKQAELFDNILDGKLEDLKIEKGSELDRVLNLLLGSSGKSEGFLKNLESITYPILPAIGPAMENFIQIAELLSPVKGHFQFNLASGRGFEYYTGMMLQFNSGGVRIGGGGRYDDLFPLINSQVVPACGFALYLDTLTGMVKPPSSKGDSSQAIAVYPREPTRELIGAGFELCRLLRDEGFTAYLEPTEEEAQKSHRSISVRSKNGTMVFSLREKSGRPEKIFVTTDNLVGELAKVV
ncbi:MAG: HisS family protein [Dehalococcoidia bacterium]|nr:HisS family protein [Dehalococcoidia bacterium]MDZ4245677.1 HisS family protein [Dehalococcoidia bacterium]